MLNLQPDRATIWWTLDDFETLKENREIFLFSRKTLQQDPISVIIPGSDIKFDTPESWLSDEAVTIAFKKIPSGSYVARGKGFVYEAVRAQTENTIWLLGNSKDDELGRGTFIIGIPARP
jgi:hypothetical protein